MLPPDESKVLPSVAELEETFVTFGVLSKLGGKICLINPTGITCAFASTLMNNKTTIFKLFITLILNTTAKKPH